ncbi:MAG: nucleotidyltransferase domain-containing protein [bacterium]
MQPLNNYILKLVEWIKKLHPFKIVLFGSYAWGNPNKESDLDVVVVLEKEIPPKNFKEKMENFLLVKKLIRDINEIIPIDLIVYTKQEWEKFLQMGSYFSKKLSQEGKVL